MLHLAVVLGLVEAAERPGDEPVGAQRPLLEPEKRTRLPVPSGPVFVPVNVEW